MNNRKPITFYEALTMLLIYLSITEDPFLWWFAFTPFIYQGMAEYAAKKAHERWLEKTQNETDDILKKGIPDHLKKDE